LTKLQQNFIFPPLRLLHLLTPALVVFAATPAHAILLTRWNCETALDPKEMQARVRDLDWRNRGLPNLDRQASLNIGRQEVAKLTQKMKDNPDFERVAPEDVPKLRPGAMIVGVGVDHANLQLFHAQVVRPGSSELKGTGLVPTRWNYLTIVDAYGNPRRVATYYEKGGRRTLPDILEVYRDKRDSAPLLYPKALSYAQKFPTASLDVPYHLTRDADALAWITDRAMELEDRVDTSLWVHEMFPKLTPGRFVAGIGLANEAKDGSPLIYGVEQIDRPAVVGYSGLLIGGEQVSSNLLFRNFTLLTPDGIQVFERLALITSYRTQVPVTPRGMNLTPETW
jgi:hypothetical protein